MTGFCSYCIIYVVKLIAYWGGNTENRLARLETDSASVLYKGRSRMQIKKLHKCHDLEKGSATLRPSFQALQQAVQLSMLRAAQACSRYTWQPRKDMHKNPVAWLSGIVLESITGRLAEILLNKTGSLS